jgi:hypothetical protein
VRRRLALTLVVVVLATLLQWYLNLPTAWPPPQWRWSLSSLFGGLKQIVPATAAGFVVGHKGLLLGALVGFFGRLAVTMPIYLARESSATILVPLLHAAAGALGYAVVSAAGGGTGQLLRSSFRWSGT